MVTSMTGYGKGSARIGDGEAIAEIRTVNHRFIELSIRLPRVLNGTERDLEKIIRRKIKRGHVYLTVTLTRSFDAETLRINSKLIKKVYRELSVLARKEGIPGDVDINTILSIPDVFSVDSETVPPQQLVSAVKKALGKALSSCTGMRENEGAELLRDMNGRLRTITRIASRIENRAPAALAKALARTKKRLKQLIGNAAIDENRWALEAAIMADKTDFSEELVRLNSHLGQFEKILSRGGEVSKKLTFLLQEIHREATTMGNKASDPAIIRDCLEIKENVEKIREQVQNLE